MENLENLVKEIVKEEITKYFEKGKERKKREDNFIKYLYDELVRIELDPILASTEIYTRLRLCRFYYSRSKNQYVETSYRYYMYMYYPFLGYTKVLLGTITTVLPRVVVKVLSNYDNFDLDTIDRFKMDITSFQTDTTGSLLSNQILESLSITVSKIVINELITRLKDKLVSFCEMKNNNVVKKFVEENYLTLLLPFIPTNYSVVLNVVKSKISEDNTLIGKHVLKHLYTEDYLKNLQSYPEFKTVEFSCGCKIKFVENKENLNLLTVSYLDSSFCSLDHKILIHELLPLYRSEIKLHKDYETMLSTEKVDNIVRDKLQSSKYDSNVLDFVLSVINEYDEKDMYSSSVIHNTYHFFQNDFPFFKRLDIWSEVAKKYDVEAIDNLLCTYSLIRTSEPQLSHIHKVMLPNISNLHLLSYKYFFDLIGVKKKRKRRKKSDAVEVVKSSD